MCMPLSTTPLGRLKSSVSNKLGIRDYGFDLTRSIDKSLFGYNDQTKRPDGGTVSSSAPGQVDLFRSYMQRRGLGLGARPKR